MSDFDRLWSELEPIGRDPVTGGYRRYAYQPAELHCREWFMSTAADRGLDPLTDRNGNLWAWWMPNGCDRKARALVVGSHLDSVPDGGAFDGPLGVVSAFAALDDLRATGWHPPRPVAVVAFADEEGAPYGIACAGSRLLTGELDPERARGLRDRDGRTMGEAMVAAGHDPNGLGRDAELLARIGCYVELHVEQGRGLVDIGAPVGVASSIWPHGRYRFDFHGQANHAGTTRMADRHDPMVAFASTALAARAVALATDARATFGRMDVQPNGTNAVPSLVRAWLDARAATDADLLALVRDIEQAARESAAVHGVGIDMVPESVSGATVFDAVLREQARSAASAALGGVSVPILPTGAGHDAGILAAAGIPSAMLFVRNPTGISHAPEEFAEQDDCQAGVRALAGVMQGLA
ncbi:MAG: allantoate amidohydrolase [Actinomycetales bacterium]